MRSTATSVPYHKARYNSQSTTLTPLALPSDRASFPGANVRADYQADASTDHDSIVRANASTVTVAFAGANGEPDGGANNAADADANAQTVAPSYSEAITAAQSSSDTATHPRTIGNANIGSYTLPIAFADALSDTLPNLRPDSISIGSAYASADAITYRHTYACSECNTLRSADPRADVPTEPRTHAGTVESPDACSIAHRMLGRVRRNSGEHHNRDNLDVRWNFE